VLLKNVLTMDSKVVDELGDTLRAEYDQEDTNEYEIEMLRRTGTVNVASGDRLPLKDSPFKSPSRDLMSLFSGTWNSTLVDDASAMLSNMFTRVLGDDGDADRKSPIGGRRSASSEGSASIMDNYEKDKEKKEKVDVLGLQDIDPEDLGVLVCALPPKNRDSQTADK
jgi:hypothetical protein